MLQNNEQYQELKITTDGEHVFDIPANSRIRLGLKVTASQAKIIYRLAADAELTLLTSSAVSQDVCHQAILTAPGSRVVMLSLIFGLTDQINKIKLISHHQAANTYSTMSTKGLADDQNKITYNGLIKIDKPAVDCQGYQQANFLTLSQQAKVVAVPDLEIANSQVGCSHGVTVGRLSPESLFYLQSRGLSDRQARQALASGHLAGLADGLTDDIIKEQILQIINRYSPALYD